MRRLHRRVPGLVTLLALMAACGTPGLAQSASGSSPAPGPPPQAAPPFAGPPSSPAKLSGAAAWAALVGNTVAGKTAGDTFLEYFDRGGTVRYADKDGPSSGTWSIQGDQVCFDFPEDDERSCSVFEVTGSTGTSEVDGATIRFEILPGNAKGL